jgi:hypothetical protein
MPIKPAPSKLSRGMTDGMLIALAVKRKSKYRQSGRTAVNTIEPRATSNLLIGAKKDQVGLPRSKAPTVIETACRPASSSQVPDGIRTSFSGSI